METARISPKFQVVIPKAIREQLNLVPGEIMQVIAWGDRIELLPVRRARELRGFLNASGATLEREDDDRL